MKINKSTTYPKLKGRVNYIFSAPAEGMTDELGEMGGSGSSAEIQYPTEKLDIVQPTDEEVIKTYIPTFDPGIVDEKQEIDDYISDTAYDLDKEEGIKEEKNNEEAVTIIKFIDWKIVALTVGISIIILVIVYLATRDKK